MTPRTRTIAAALIGAFVLAACGNTLSIEPQEERARAGAELFKLRCSGCHTFDAAAARGSKSDREILGGERTNGPNFNTRKVKKDDALFAIRNGGFSGAIMPANIVVGDDAEQVAEFIDKYSGKGGENSSQQSGQSGASPGSP